MAAVAELRPLFVILLIMAVLIILLCFQDRSPAYTQSVTQIDYKQPAPQTPVYEDSPPKFHTMGEEPSDVPVDFNEDTIDAPNWVQGDNELPGHVDDWNVKFNYGAAF